MKKLKGIDFKELLLQKGERLALGVAVGIAAIMIVGFGLASVLGGSSASANADKVKTARDKADSAWKVSTPDPKTGEVAPDLLVVKVKPVNPEQYACALPYFRAIEQEDRKWRKPEVLAADEFHGGLFKGPLQIFMLNDRTSPPTVGVLEAKKIQRNDQTQISSQRFMEQFSDQNAKKKKRQPNQFVMPTPQQGVAGSPGVGDQRPVGPRGGSRLPGPAGLAMLDPNSLGQPPASMAQEIKMVRVDQLKDDPRKLAETNLPVRMIVVEAAFPYRAQLEEFRRAMRFGSVEEMIMDPQVRPEFTGFNVERKVYGLGGAQIEDWTPLDLEAAAKVLRVRAVGTEPEDLELDRLGIIVRPNRLVMRLPKLAPRNQKYPEAHLEGIDRTKKELEASLQGGEAPPAPKSRFENIDVFDDGNPDANRQPGEIQGARPEGQVAPGRRLPQANLPAPAPRPAVRQPADNIGSPAGQQPQAIPEKCLVRFFDPTVLPGRTYEYRIQIRMANPNHEFPKRAAYPSLTQDEEIVGPWQLVAWKAEGADDKDEKEAKDTKDAKKVSKITVTEELLFYVLDPAADKQAASGKSQVPVTNQDQAVVQIHKWVDEQRTKPNQQATVPVGDWSILERRRVHRGEYIGEVSEVEVAFWDPSLDRFSFAIHPDEQVRRRQGKGTIVRTHKGIPVDFATDPVRGTKALLIDFEGGERSLPPVPGKPPAKEVGPVEMLVLSSEGKLIVRTSDQDAEKKDRKERLEAWKTWLDWVRNQADSGSTGSPGDPFTPRTPGARPGGNPGTGQ
jgi:hypothetical protein